MTQEDKQLLLADLCARLPYGVILQLTIWDDEMSNARLTGIDEDGNLTADVPADCVFNIEDVKPFLRPMSSMTEEEKEEYCNLQDKFLFSSQYPVTDAYELFDWLNKHHFDYRGLIEKGLAIEVNENNNPYKD